MDYNTELNNLKSILEKEQKELSSMEGEYNLLSKQVEEANSKLENIDKQKLIYKKSIEFLRKLEEITKNSLIQGFESLISLAMRSICQDDYGFKFLFKKRGNSQELWFLIKSPGCNQYHDIMRCQAGGAIDVMSVALRIALLQKLKLKGIVALDESFRNIHGKEPIKNAFKFLKYIHEKLNKQILFVTGIEQTEGLEFADNIIKLPKEENNG